MKDRRRPAAHISHERWLVSYADFVTLLFAFFVVLYASAQVDKRKAVILSHSIESAFQQLGLLSDGAADPGQLPGTAAAAGVNSAHEPARFADTKLAADVNHKPDNFDAIRDELEKALAAEIKRNEVAVHMEPDGLVVSLREVGFFDSGSATIKPGAENAFSRVAAILQEHSCAVRVEGHTDNVPIHTAQFASNWELSTARASEIVKTLITEDGIPPQRLSAAGYAEFHPVAANDTAHGRQLNRRVDLVLVAAPMRFAPPAVPQAHSSLNQSTSGQLDQTSAARNSDGRG